MPPPPGRRPSAGSSAISTSAMSWLVVASQPGKSMPAALRMRLRPPSHPTGEGAPPRLGGGPPPAVAPHEVPRPPGSVPGQLHIDAGGVLAEADDLAATEDR